MQVVDKIWRRSDGRVFSRERAWEFRGFVEEGEMDEVEGDNNGNRDGNDELREDLK